MPRVSEGRSPLVIGMSPSGKAPDFDSGIRRFESCHPSHFKIAHGSLAQLVEQRPFKAWVQGSSPWRATKKPDTHPGIWFFDFSPGLEDQNPTCRWQVGRWVRAPSLPYDLPKANRQRVPGEPPLSGGQGGGVYVMKICRAINRLDRIDTIV